MEPWLPCTSDSASFNFLFSSCKTCWIDCSASLIVRVATSRAASILFSNSSRVRCNLLRFLISKRLFSPLRLSIRFKQRVTLSTSSGKSESGPRLRMLKNGSARTSASATRITFIAFVWLPSLIVPEMFAAITSASPDPP